MIGQQDILDNIDILIKNDCLPRFIIISGQRGQGKKTLANEISNKCGYPIINVGKSIDDVRQVIQVSYEQVNPVIYLLADYDDVSLNAKNSLLKVVEEPPNNSYFIMTVKQLENILPTIRSRCFEISLHPYSYSDKVKMISEISKNISGDEFSKLVIFDNYWQIKTVASYGVNSFYDFVLKVFNNIYKVQGANSFKFSQELDLKNDGKGYDVELFFVLYSYMCYDCQLTLKISGDYDENDIVYTNCLDITRKYKELLNVKGVNRQFVIDGWLLDIRKEWLNYEAK